MKIDQKSAISEELLAQLQDLGSRLARLRIARGVRQEEAALRAGISRRTVVGIENGAPSVAIGQIIRLLDAIAPGKTLCNDETYLAYLRQVFNIPEPAKAA